MEDQQLPPLGYADVRIIAATPEAAREVALLLRSAFASTEQRSYPTGRDGTGTRLHLTVDTTRVPGDPDLLPERSSGGDHPHSGEV
ncbi:hypothetical protein [Streptacidiphilus melanogenes]|uniref:hypothetical protein n=1 Tax=Streptacidiphilus melanogenes TaxID=411235 RepID=UPI0005A6569F|nr:hypothetical protein [Streptacidiphilus melanogenes]